MYAISSFALNRINTEWYRSMGYDFDITINQEESFEKMRKNIRRFEINQQKN